LINGGGRGKGNMWQGSERVVGLFSDGKMKQPHQGRIQRSEALRAPVVRQGGKSSKTGVYSLGGAYDYVCGRQKKGGGSAMTTKTNQSKKTTPLLKGEMHLHLTKIERLRKSSPQESIWQGLAKKEQKRGRLMAPREGNPMRKAFVLTLGLKGTIWKETCPGRRQMAEEMVPTGGKDLQTTRIKKRVGKSGLRRAKEGSRQRGDDDGMTMARTRDIGLLGPYRPTRAGDGKRWPCEENRKLMAIVQNVPKNKKITGWGSVSTFSWSSSVSSSPSCTEGAQEKNARQRGCGTAGDQNANSSQWGGGDLTRKANYTPSGRES